MLELATAELLESETNASLRIGVKGRRCRGLVVTATGCALVVGIEHGAQVLVNTALPDHLRDRGPRALAARCDAVLRWIHWLPDDYVPTVAFDDPSNATRFRDRLG
jgi:hypothetical protein